MRKAIRKIRGLTVLSYFNICKCGKEIPYYSTCCGPGHSVYGKNIHKGTRCVNCGSNNTAIRKDYKRSDCSAALRQHWYKNEVGSYICHSCYNTNPRRKSSIKIYLQKPSVKARIKSWFKSYRQTPEYKVRSRERDRKRRNTPNRKASEKRYEGSQKGKATRKRASMRFSKTQKFKSIQRKYTSSKKGKTSRSGINFRHVFRNKVFNTLSYMNSPGHRIKTTSFPRK